MVNGSDLFVSLVVGLAMPLALLDGLRALAGSPQALDVADNRSAAWLLAVVAGPGLFVERMLAGWRAGELGREDVMNASIIALGWAVLYGYVVLELARRLFSI
jgi:hypothetical protein